MTTGTVRIERAPDGIWIITPDDAPSVLADAAGIDVAVLEVLGGHLSWSVLADHTVPVAVLDDVASAQNWVWAVFGEEVALAVAAGSGRDVTVEPARPRVAAGARRLAYAHWAARWWPASTIDAIPPLDEGLLNGEIATLVEECDLLVDGVDTVAATGPALAERPGRDPDAAEHARPGARYHRIRLAPVPTRARRRVRACGVVGGGARRREHDRAGECGCGTGPFPTRAGACASTRADRHRIGHR